MLFLTTNLVQHFDDAILNGIHLTMRYEGLRNTVKETVITSFLKSVYGGLSNVGTNSISRRAYVSLNGS